MDAIRADCATSDLLHTYKAKSRHSWTKLRLDRIIDHVS